MRGPPAWDTRWRERRTLGAAFPSPVNRLSEVESLLSHAAEATAEPSPGEPSGRSQRDTPSGSWVGSAGGRWLAGWQRQQPRGEGDLPAACDALPGWEKASEIPSHKRPEGERDRGDALLKTSRRCEEQKRAEDERGGGPWSDLAPLPEPALMPYGLVPARRLSQPLERRSPAAESNG